MQTFCGHIGRQAVEEVSFLIGILTSCLTLQTSFGSKERCCGSVLQQLPYFSSPWQMETSGCHASDMVTWCDMTL